VLSQKTSLGDTMQILAPIRVLTRFLAYPTKVNFIKARQPNSNMRILLKTVTSAEKL
jgi:hypothetical protein